MQPRIATIGEMAEVNRLLQDGKVTREELDKFLERREVMCWKLSATAKGTETPWLVPMKAKVKNG